MNGAFVHLAFNHVPVIGMPFIFLLFAGGLWRKSRDLIGAGFVGLILVALLTIIAFKSGGPAARLARTFPEVKREAIHEHAEAADWALWTVLGGGLVGVVGLWFSARSGELPMGMAILGLVGSLLTSTVLGRVAHLGGLIRHPEVAMDFQPPAPPAVPGGPAAPEPPH